VFGLRHPDRTRALVLDAAFDDSYDPFARDAAAALGRSWETLCARAGTCPGILGDITRAARRLERHPLEGTGVDASGARSDVHLTGQGLAQLLYDATYVFTIYRDFPAALAAYEAGDPDPLLRLAAENPPPGAAGDPHSYSEGAYAAIACHDYPTIWDRSATLPERVAQLEEAVAALAPRSFSPFPNDIWLPFPYEDQLVRGCLRWPALAPGDAPTPTLTPHPDLPVLVLDGEFDVTTPLANSMAAAAAWPNATFVPVANEIHISALYDYERCASRIVRRFVRTLEPGDTSCASHTPEIRVVESFPGEVGEAPSARPASGRDRSTALDRRMAWAAVETVADAFNRWWNVLYGGTGVGLRGGTYEIGGPFYSFDRPAGRLRLEGPGATGVLRISFATDRAEDETRLVGRIEGRRIVLVSGRTWSS
jgi:pimeloyl-ACP methyl ester carboxylesterase